MTALKQYERLESLGLWRETNTAQLREVVVSFGAASLVLSDKNDMPLAHWSLAAVHPLNNEEMPRIFAPDQGAEETLEIDDTAMIEAIGEVQDALYRKKRHPGRVRLVLGGVMLAGLLGFTIFGLPEVAANYATRVVPDAKVSQIGATVLSQTARLTGRPCDAPLGAVALEKMRGWLLGPDYTLHVVDMGARFSTHLPGKNILINRSLLEEYSGPEVAAGFVLMELALAQETSPMTALFHTIGTRATLTFLANGSLPDSALSRYAEQQLAGAFKRPDDARLLVLFAIAGLTSSPFAHALDNGLTSTKMLVDNDPVAVDYQPQLSDGDWIALQSICSG